jgi:hypothetical protein
MTGSLEPSLPAGHSRQSAVADRRTRGINYDTGFLDGPENTRRSFDLDAVRRDMTVIAEDLHCNAVRVSGADPDRLVAAGHAALDAGLELWFSPFPANLAPDMLVTYLADCAGRAEQLRQRSDRVTLVLGCEASLFCSGFLPGDGLFDRLATMTTPPWPRTFQTAFASLPTTLNHVLTDAVAAARERFGGPITYASGSWEPVDWAPFDLVGVDLYRDQDNADRYRRQLQFYLRHDKPVAVTEFGCCTYRGAAGKGGLGFTIIDPDTSPPRLDGCYDRSEDEQVAYFRELTAIFDQEGVDATFWFTFAGFELPHRPDPVHDLDMASFGVVKISEYGPGSGSSLRGWEPKKVFHALAAVNGAAAYRNQPSGS